MKNQTNTAPKAQKNKKMTLRDYYKGLPARVITADKADFLERIAKRCEVSESTVRNWCMYGFKPRYEKYIKILSEETGIPAEDLFAYLP